MTLTGHLTCQESPSPNSCDHEMTGGRVLLQGTVRPEAVTSLAHIYYQLNSHYKETPFQTFSEIKYCCFPDIFSFINSDQKQHILKLNSEVKIKLFFRDLEINKNVYQFTHCCFKLKT